MDLTTVDKIIQNARSRGLFPGAALGIITPDGKRLSRYYGRHTFTPWSREVDDNSLFDLASLTKPLCTALACAYLVDQKKLSLDETLDSFFPSCPKDKKAITITHLLTHSSGLEAWTPIYVSLKDKSPHQGAGHDAACKIILEKPLAYKPGQKSLYSDLGFILLGRIVAMVSGMELWELTSRHIYGPLGLSSITSPPRTLENLEQFVPTGFCPHRKRVTWGSVNDLNAWKIGGVPGHAGLFSSLSHLIGLLGGILEAFFKKEHDFPISHDTLSRFLTYRSQTPDIPWALGLDRPSPKGSTCGSHFSPNSLGHLGYTGTSFWMDLDRRLCVIFLCARTFPFDTEEGRARMKSFRIELHNGVMAALLNLPTSQ
ncbi:MAG: beta-lactamase family protein [Thermodesulfobacteria bacterium]|nr:beta-lactamase family protein [Thermodesulfobacteriota bacterium]